MFRRRDHEEFIGGYDPEHEMPATDRDPGDRYQSDLYRQQARDTRFGYRWSPDRFEGRTSGGYRPEDRMRGSWERDRDLRERELRDRDFRDRDFRDRDSMERSRYESQSRGGYDRYPYGEERDRGFDRFWSRDAWRSDRERRPENELTRRGGEYGGYDQEYGRNFGRYSNRDAGYRRDYDTGSDYDRDRFDRWEMRDRYDRDLDRDRELDRNRELDRDRGYWDEYDRDRDRWGRRR